MTPPRRTYRIAAILCLFLSGYVVADMQNDRQAQAAIPSLNFEPKSLPANESQPDFLVRVIDGDSVVLPARFGMTMSARMIDIDAPETNQPFGKEATAEVRRLCQGQPIRITPPKNGSSKDGYGRALIRLECGGVDVNRHLVQHGLAWVFDRYNQDSELPEIENAAERSCAGLWADRRATPPWLYRAPDRTLAQNERREPHGLCRV